MKAEHVVRLVQSALMLTNALLLLGVGILIWLMFRK